MSTKIEESLQEQTATTAFQLVWGAIKGVGTFVAQQESVQKGMRVYANSFLERFGKVKILGMAEPIPLREIYTAAQVVSPNFLRRFRSVSELQGIVAPHRISASVVGIEIEEELFDLELERRGVFWVNREEPRRPCLELANEVQFLNVLGAPGAGKTTFLRRLGLEALLPRPTKGNYIRTSLGLKPGLDDSEFGRYAHDCLPVLVELRRFKVEEIDLLRLVRLELGLCGLPESEELAKLLLAGGRCLLLLDGLDEVPSDKLDAVISHLRDFIDRNSRNRYVMSCRAAFYKDYFPRFADVLLAEFDDAQIESFVRNWFRSERDRQTNVADEFLSLLSSPAHAASKELASTPLLLTFLCLTYDDRLSLPVNRSALYGKALDILLERWSASKRVHNEPVYRELHSDLEVQMLAEIAVRGFRENKYFFSGRELAGLIAEFLHSELNAPKHLDSNKILEAIEIQQGLLTRRAQDAYSFSHLTLQEYLASVWYTSNHQTEGLIQEHMLDPRWREVIILTAGLAGKADDLLRKMIAVVSKFATAHDAEIYRLLQWATDVVIPSVDPPKDAAARSLALALALGRAPSADSAFRLARELDSSYVLEGVHQHIRRHADVGGGMLDAAHGQRFSNAEASRAGLKSYIVDAGIPLIKSLRDSASFNGEWEKATSELYALADSAPQLSSVAELEKALLRAYEIPFEAVHLPQELRSSKRSRRVLSEYARACRLIVACKSAATSVSRVTWQSICLRIAVPAKSA